MNSYLVTLSTSSGLIKRRILANSAMQGAHIALDYIPANARVFFITSKPEVQHV